MVTKLGLAILRLAIADTQLLLPHLGCNGKLIHVLVVNKPETLGLKLTKLLGLLCLTVNGGEDDGSILLILILGDIHLGDTREVDTFHVRHHHLTLQVRMTQHQSVILLGKLLTDIIELRGMNRLEETLDISRFGIDGEGITDGRLHIKHGMTVIVTRNLHLLNLYLAGTLNLSRQINNLSSDKLKLLKLGNLNGLVGKELIGLVQSQRTTGIEELDVLKTLLAQGNDETVLVQTGNLIIDL